jgi:hypothetical protein
VGRRENWGPERKSSGPVYPAAIPFSTSGTKCTAASEILRLYLELQKNQLHQSLRTTRINLKKPLKASAGNCMSAAVVRRSRECLLFVWEKGLLRLEILVLTSRSYRGSWTFLRLFTEALLSVINSFCECNNLVAERQIFRLQTWNNKLCWLRETNLSLCRIWGFYSCSYEQFCRIGYNTVQFVESKQTLRRKLLPPSVGLKNKKSKTLTLKMEALCSSET